MKTPTLLEQARAITVRKEKEISAEELEMMIALINGEVRQCQVAEVFNMFSSAVAARCYVVISSAIAQGKIPKIKNGK